MKKGIALILALVLTLLTAGCGSGSKKDTQTKDASVTAAAAKVDVDLTTLSSTMVYSEVYNMMNTPQNYIGKTVKAKGPFSVYHDEANDNYFFAVLIADATACCSQGLEFVWAGDHKYPDGYPAQGTEIVVTGTFNTYMDGTEEYSHLENAALEISKA